MGGKQWRWCVLGRHVWVTSTCGHTRVWLRCQWCNRLRMVTPAEWEARNEWEADR